VTQRPAFLEPWWDLRGDGPAERTQRDALARQHHTELAPDHPLYGQPIAVIAQSAASDDIIVQLASNGWAQVHLTWTSTVQRPPWPTTTSYATIEALEHDLVQNT
jgi:hypothetical protein